VNVHILVSSSPIAEIRKVLIPMVVTGADRAVRLCSASREKRMKGRIDTFYGTHKAGAASGAAYRRAAIRTIESVRAKK